jgi:hypothetical protein
VQVHHRRHPRRALAHGGRTRAVRSGLCVSDVGIYDCSDARDPDTEAQVLAALPRQDLDVLEIDRAPHARDERCVVHVDRACLRSATPR